MWLIIAAAMAWLLSASAASAQVTLNWTKDCATDVERFKPTDILIEPGGDIYLGGTISMVNGAVESHAVVKYSRHGQLLWSRSISLDNYCTMVLDPRIARDSQGNIVLLHQIYDPATDGCPGNLTKFNAEGTQLWSIKPDVDASAFSIDAADAVAAVGMPDDLHFTFQKFSKDAVPQWSASHMANYVSYVFQLLGAADGSVYFLSNGPQTSNDDIVLYKYSPAGTLLWTRVFNSAPGGDDWPGEMTFDSSGNIIIAGLADADGESGPDSHDLVTLKYNPDGDLLWTKSYSSGIGGYGSLDLWYDWWLPAVTLDSSGNIIVAGRNAGGTATRYDFATVKYDASGNELWARRFNGPGCDDEASDVVAGPDGNVYVVGKSEDSCPGTTDYTSSFEFVQYDSAGNLLGHDRHSTPAGEDYRYIVPKIAMHPQGSAFVIAGGQLMKYACVALSPGSAAPPYSASSASINVTPGIGCPSWTATSSDASWLTITGGASGSGAGSVTYAVTQNSTGAQRVGIVSIGDATFVVTQASDPCVLVTPGNLSAFRYGYGNRLTWNAVPGTLYEVQRKNDKWSWQSLSTTATSPFDELYTFSTLAYLYRVRAVSSCTTTGFSNADLANGAGYTDDPIVPGQTVVRARHIQDVQIAINAVRSMAGLDGGWYTDNENVVAGGTIKAVHIIETRVALNEALTALGLPLPSYTDPELAPGTPVRAIHIQQLRDVMR